MEERVRERCEHEQRNRCERAADQLVRERPLEQPAELSPLLLRLVAEAVLDRRLLHGEVEQGLEEARRGHDDGVEAEDRGRREDARGGDRGGEAKGGRGVDSRSGYETPNGHVSSV